MLKNIIPFLLLLVSQQVMAQELLCTVSVSAPDASKITTDPKVFKTLENTVTQFMNATKWTSDVYEENEKINCNIFIAIKSQSGTSNYSGSISIVSKRPVFNSDYETTVLNIIDNDFNFIYKEFEPIEVAENQFVSNLSHVLAFYANIIIGMDYETFSEKGGEKYFLKAQEMTNNISANDAKNYPGWKAYDKNKRSKYWLVTNLLNTRYDNYRKAHYLYYRQGLDNFYTDETLAKKNIKDALELLAKISLDDPNIYIMQMWSESKSKETIDMFKGATDAEKTEIINILRKVDPVNADKYNTISK